MTTFKFVCRKCVTPCKLEFELPGNPDLEPVACAFAFDSATWIRVEEEPSFPIYDEDEHETDPKYVGMNF